MIRLLREPYPISNSVSRILLTGLVVSAFVALFLLFYQPFGLQTMAGNKTMQIAGYGLVTFAGSMLASLFPRLLFRSYFSEQRWTVAKQILWIFIIILVIAAGNLFYTTWLGYSEVTPKTGAFFLLSTFAVGVFPISIATLLNHIRLLKANTRMAEQMNSTLGQPDEIVSLIITESAEKPSAAQWVFVSDNGKEKVEVTPENLLFVESADNYSTFHVLENGMVRKKIIRGSLTRMEEQVNDRLIFRCHRTFIVNLGKVKNVTGNSQGYRIELNGSDTEIPVSRNFGKELLARLEKLKS